MIASRRNLNHRSKCTRFAIAVVARLAGAGWSSVCQDDAGGVGAATAIVGRAKVFRGARHDPGRRRRARLVHTTSALICETRIAQARDSVTQESILAGAGSSADRWIGTQSSGCASSVSDLAGVREDASSAAQNVSRLARARGLGSVRDAYSVGTAGAAWRRTHSECALDERLGNRAEDRGTVAARRRL